MKKLAVGILAHVDAGKTTLSEAMLYTGGAVRKLGRVDKGDAFLDTYELEKKRGITIFSKQAMLRWGEMQVTLLDTPGHVDFSAEMERTLQVLDYAILVISGTAGVQGHTQTLWRLLARYGIPTFLFVNKMDLADGRKEDISLELNKKLDGNIADFSEQGTESFYENLATCSETALEQYLESGQIAPAGVAEMIRAREVFPCFFGSALKLDGIEEFLKGMEDYMLMPEYPSQFGAKVFKIARDNQGNRLTYMKITGGRLQVKDLIDEEKVNQIRVYSGDKFEAVKEADAGTVCAVTGPAKTSPGRGIGIEAASAMPILEPVLTYRIQLPEEVDAAVMLPKLLQLEEEEPELHITWQEEQKEIHAQIMGEIQMEILKSLIAERFGVRIEFGGRSIVYKETIRNTVEGVGHFEPLRHYAEVHLLMEPDEPGSGLSFAAACSEDVLDRNWQRLVLTHLEEREHKGVLTGSPITDMRITLMSGRAHLKHTEGGDFRQAVYRAVRHGLMQADSVLLEPVYDFRLEVPEKLLGRAMTDVERMHGTFEPPALEGEYAVLTGNAPVACMDGYQQEVTAYTGGRGRLSCALKGYAPCHNEEEVIEAIGYDADGDTDNPSGSVFCAHGAGFVVNWDEVADYMHLESCLPPEIVENNGEQPQSGGKRAGKREKAGTETEEMWIGTDEIDAILARTYNANKRDKSGASRRRWGGCGSSSSGYSGYASGNRPQYGTAYGRDMASMSAVSGGTPAPGASAPAGTSAAGTSAIRSHGKAETREEYLLVDGYNIIFAWEELRELADRNMDSARGKLLDILCNYQGAKKCQVIAVFDAYRVQGHATEFLDYHNIHVVYTKEAETADQYIEKFAHENARKYHVTVATSDRLEQIIIRGQGCRLMSAREFEEEIGRMNEQIRQDFEEKKTGEKQYMTDFISEEVMKKMKEGITEND